MAVKSLLTPAKSSSLNVEEKTVIAVEEKVQKFISQGGSLAASANVDMDTVSDDDHRLTLRIPKWLLDKVDVKRKQRIGTISRNLWILELIEKATQK